MGDPLHLWDNIQDRVGGKKNYLLATGPKPLGMLNRILSISWQKTLNYNRPSNEPNHTLEPRLRATRHLERRADSTLETPKRAKNVI